MAVLRLSSWYRSVSKLPETVVTLPPMLPLQRILFALHVVDYAPQAVKLCCTLATVCQASLSVLQVLEPTPSAYLPSRLGQACLTI